jgi:putative methionine-R-sulfoxide reductase with GAF domain
LATILEPKQLISAVVNQIQQEFHYYYVQLYLLDESGENLVVAGGTGEAGQVLHAQKHRIPVGKGLVGEAAANNRHVLVDDVALIGTWLSNPLLPDTQAELAVPIAASNTVLGVLDVQQDRKNAFTEEDVALLQSVAASVAIALQNARLYEQAQTQAEYEAQLNKMNQQLVGVTNMDQMLQVAAQQLGELSGVRRATVQLSRRQNGRMQEKS